MRLAAFLLCTAAFGVQFTITPALVTQCVGGLGQVTLRWSDAGVRPVQVRLYSRVGPPITGVEGSSGEATTGVWVANGMTFVLTDDMGAELARVVASVRCNAVVDPPGNESFFPLSVGNRWVYRYDDRLITSGYEHWSIIGNEERFGRVYAILRRFGDQWLLREDDQHRVYRLLNSGIEETLLDPVADPRRTSISIGLGDFSNALERRTVSGGLIYESSLYARGVGLVWSSATMATGSSGGFTDGRQLIEAEINGRVYSMPAARLELAPESTTLGVTDRRVTNCAVPCYFVACHLAPGADLEGTYKPCFRTRVITEVAPGILDLLDTNDKVLASREVDTGTTYVQLPLYSQPNVPFAPGAYRLRLRLRDAQGESSLGLHIE